MLASVVQLKGPWLNDPVTTPPLIVTALLLAMQPETCPVTREGSVPPPDFTNRGEKLTATDSMHLTDPGAAPVKEMGFADADDDQEPNPPTIATKHATTNQRRTTSPVPLDTCYALGEVSACGSTEISPGARLVDLKGH